MQADHEHFIGVCLDLARRSIAEGNRPIGSVIVRAGEIVGEGRNQSKTALDPTAHAEVAAIRDAAQRLGTNDLSGCTLYSGLEPCPMCLGTILEAKITLLVLGGRHAGIGRKDRGRYTVESMLELTNGKLEVVTGVRARECEKMWLDWKASQSS
jgi:tRNA(Arg) A34 adenosine deaminase TadA